MYIATLIETPSKKIPSKREEFEESWKAVLAFSKMHSAVKTKIRKMTKDHAEQDYAARCLLTDTEDEHDILDVTEIYSKR